MLNLTKVNHATIIPESARPHAGIPKSEGFRDLKSTQPQSQICLERGSRMTGDKPVDDAAISSGSEYGSVEDFAAALASRKCDTQIS